MKHLKFSYSTTYYFDEPVNNQYFTIKCLPRDNDRQKVTVQRTEVSTNDFCDNAVDSFGNRALYGKIKNAHPMFHFCVAGTAETTDGFSDTDDKFLDVFSISGTLTKAGNRIKSHIKKIRKRCEGKTNTEKCNIVNEYVNHLLEYKQWETDVDTTAEDACRLGIGVCQDYSHIMISILRELGIPARYVVGMMTGEGFSHAWVEAWLTDDMPGWYGFDPTNNKRVDDSYIKISHGRDYHDCMVMRGIFVGNTAQKQMVSVSVEEI